MADVHISKKALMQPGLVIDLKNLSYLGNIHGLHLPLSIWISARGELRITCNAWQRDPRDQGGWFRCPDGWPTPEVIAELQVQAYGY